MSVAFFINTSPQATDVKAILRDSHPDDLYFAYVGDDDLLLGVLYRPILAKACAASHPA